MTLLADLKQRKMVQWALAYLASAWLLMQLVDVLGGRWGVTEAQARLVDLLLAVGFFLALVIAWFHGEKGEQRVGIVEMTLFVLILGIGGYLVASTDLSDDAVIAGNEEQRESILQADEISDAPWIAVLPFKVQSDNNAMQALAAGLTTDITGGLARFSHLLVLSGTTTASMAGSMVDVRDLGRELGARYVLEGDLRHSGDTLRLTVRLVSAIDGTNIWSQRFERDSGELSTFELQDELTARIVATVGDVYGVVARQLSSRIVDKAADEMTPYEAMLLFSLNRQSVSAASHLKSRVALERAVEIEPSYADAWAALAHVYVEEFISVYNPLPNPLERALAAVRRALELDPTSSSAYYSLAVAQYFSQNLGAFHAAVERAIELNPYDTQNLAMLGILLGYSGDWDNSVEMTTRAMTLNPDHPGWYRFNTFFNEYRQGNYDDALSIAERIRMPGYWGDGLARTLANAQLGNEEATQIAVADLQQVWPDFEREYYSLGLVNWMFAQPELVDHIVDGLHKAGLDMVTGQIAATED